MGTEIFRSDQAPIKTGYTEDVRLAAKRTRNPLYEKHPCGPRSVDDVQERTGTQPAPGAALGGTRIIRKYLILMVAQGRIELSTP